MPNGKPGDHPITDILYHDEVVYSRKADELVREILKLSGEKAQRKLGDLLYQDYNPYMKPNVSQLEKELEKIRDECKRDARSRGFEVDN